jgi:hypothetical protein
LELGGQIILDRKVLEDSDHNVSFDLGNSIKSMDALVCYCINVKLGGVEENDEQFSPFKITSKGGPQVSRYVILRESRSVCNLNFLLSPDGTLFDEKERILLKLLLSYERMLAVPSHFKEPQRIDAILCGVQSLQFLRGFERTFFPEFEIGDYLSDVQFSLNLVDCDASLWMIQIHENQEAFAFQAIL